MEMDKKFLVLQEEPDSEQVTFDELKRLIRNYLLLEITSDSIISIRQYKDLKATFKLKYGTEEVTLEYGDLYIADGNDIIDFLKNPRAVTDAELKSFIEKANIYYEE